MPVSCTVFTILHVYSKILVMMAVGSIVSCSSEAGVVMCTQAIGGQMHCMVHLRDVSEIVVDCGNLFMQGKTLLTTVAKHMLQPFSSSPAVRTVLHINFDFRLSHKSTFSACRKPGQG